MFREIHITIIALLMTAVTAMSQQLPEPMKPARLVNDFAGMFSATERQALEEKLVDFDRATSTQIAVVTVADLDGSDISDYSARLFDKWGIGGSSEKNNGILILIKPKTASSRGEVFISIGYGLEGAVPDALAGRIVDYDILPAFRKGMYYQGIDNATSTLMSLSSGEFTAEQYLEHHKKGVGMGSIIGLLVVLIAIFFTFGSRGGNRGSRTISSDSDVASAILLGSILSGRRHSGGGFGGFSGGGGGFGGFGGGFTGGGGAGGSW